MSFIVLYFQEVLSISIRLLDKMKLNVNTIKKILKKINRKLYAVPNMAVPNKRTKPNKFSLCKRDG